MTKKPITLTTERLILRPWKPEDLQPFAQLNADPRVREFFPSVLTQEESNRQAKIHSDYINEHGWGFWAVSAPDVSDFIGMIGIAPIPFKSHFTPAIEIGWRLAVDYWGKGYAAEGAQAVLQYGFATLHLPEIVAITSMQNVRSQNVMKKIGMHRDPADDFDHPNVPDGNPVKRHMLYRIDRVQK